MCHVTACRRRLQRDFPGRETSLRNISLSNGLTAPFPKARVPPKWCLWQGENHFLDPLPRAHFDYSRRWGDRLPCKPAPQRPPLPVNTACSRRPWCLPCTCTCPGPSSCRGSISCLGTRCTCSEKSGNIFRVGIFLDFVWLTTRTPHGAYARRARRNRIDPHGGEIERLGTRTRRGRLLGC